MISMLCMLGNVFSYGMVWYGMVGRDGGDTLGQSSVAFCRLPKGSLVRSWKCRQKRAFSGFNP